MQVLNNQNIGGKMFRSRSVDKISCDVEEVQNYSLETY
jgi:hypothetical protein